MGKHRSAAAELFKLDPLDVANHGKPLWVVYGPSRFWPQILCCKLLAYDKRHHLLPVGHTGHSVCIWGYSVWRGQPAFRTIGTDVMGWATRQEWGPFFYDQQGYALDHLREVTTPPIVGSGRQERGR